VKPEANPPVNILNCSIVLGKPVLTRFLEKKQAFPSRARMGGGIFYRAPLHFGNA
jgi:hypothetical protein